MRKILLTGASIAGRIVGALDRHGRSVLTTLLELGGFAAIAHGAALIYPPAGFIVGGAALIVIGYLAGGRS